MSVTSLILGIDVSPRRMGWGLVEIITGEPVACGMENIDLPDAGWSHKQVARALNATLVLNPYREIQAIFIEQPALPPVSGTKSAYSAGRAVQEAHNACERRWPHAPIEYLQPGEWKKLAGLKGNASKAEVSVQAMTFQQVLYHDDPVKYALDLSYQDAADALLIAVAGWHRNEDSWGRVVASGADNPTQEVRP